MSKKMFKRMFKRSMSFYEWNKNYYKTVNLHERKIHIKKEGKVHILIFLDKRKVDIIDFWDKKRTFSTQEVGRKMIFVSIFETSMIF